MLEQLGPYRIERLLGRGGMGAVYAGIHNDTGQVAAIKILSTTMGGDQRFRSRFMAEVETLKTLRHPNIVSLIGWGEQEGQLFYAMELVEGRSLQDEMQAGKTFHWQEVVQIGIDVCAALKHAHDHGVIHRDLKPANLLLTQEGSVKLTDFGIAKLFGASQLTAEGSVIGTADYMSPEQAEGKPINHRTDLYSLGAVLFTLLAKRTPFARSSLPQVIHSVRYDAPPLIRQFAPNIPEELESIINQLLNKDPAERIATALVLTHRLKAMLHALGGQTRADADGFDLRIDGNSPTSVESSHTGQRASEMATAESIVAPSRKSPSAVSNAADPTVATSDAAPGNAAPATAATSVEVKRSVTHFTEVDRKSPRVSPSTPGEGENSSETWKTVAGVFALLALIASGVGGWIYQNSADTIYRRIQAAATAEQLDDAKGLIDKFLAKFPNDRRSAEVDDWRRDVECGWLKSRLLAHQFKMGGKIEPYEDLYLEAWSDHQSQRESAPDKLQRMIRDYGSEQGPPGALPYVDAARHLLKRWGPKAADAE